MFGGTSAAGPHVAGAAALLLQDNPSRSATDVSLAITDGAATDVFTGNNLPDEEWGYGKLRIAESLQVADVTAPTTEALVFENPLLPGTDFVLLAPDETLAAAPTTTLTADGAAVSDSLIEVAYSWWVGFIGRENVSVTVDETIDLAGNQGQ
jgi:subtilisin family serine protease